MEDKRLFKEAGIQVTLGCQSYVAKAFIQGTHSPDNPAQIIKYRFPSEVIKLMKQIKWWEWPIDKIYANRQYFVDPEKFVSKFG